LYTSGTKQALCITAIILKAIINNVTIRSLCLEKKISGGWTRTQSICREREDKQVGTSFGSSDGNVVLGDRGRLNIAVDVSPLVYSDIFCDHLAMSNLSHLCTVSIRFSSFSSCGRCCAKYSNEPRAGEGPEEGSGEAPPGGLTDADLQSNWDEAIETFDGMDLPEDLLRGIYSYGFEKPSAIQQRAIKPTILGRDLIAQAQSGTVSLHTLKSFVFLEQRR
jgi:hypothetical protein